MTAAMLRRPLRAALRWPLFLCILAAAAGARAETPHIRFAYQDRIGSAIPIVAAEKRFFAQEGVRVRALRFSSGPACAEALYSGGADIAGMGDTTAVIVATRSPRFAIIASHAAGEHRHRVMVPADSGLRSIADLRGRRVGVKKGTSTYGGLLAALARAGMSTRDIRVIDLPPPTMTDALLAGSLDAFAASEPTPSAAEAKGARELATFGGLGNQYPILLVANRDFLDAEKAGVRRLLRALKRAERYVAGHADETAAIMASETGLPLSTTREAMRRHRYRLRLDSEIRSSLERTARFLKGQDIIETVPEVSAIVATEFLP